MHLNVGNVPRQVETEVRNLTEHLAWSNDLLHLLPRIKLALVFVLTLIVPYLIGILPVRFHSYLAVGNRDLCLKLKKLNWLKVLYAMLSHICN